MQGSFSAETQFLPHWLLLLFLLLLEVLLYIFHLKNEGTGGYGIMLKQRNYYIYTYLPDTEVFRNLPLSVTAVVFLYLLIFGIFCFWGYRADLAHRKQEQEKDEK